MFYITDRSKAVLLIWFSVFACFSVSFCTVFTFCVSIYLVRLAEWPHFGRELLIRFTVCSLCILTLVMVILVISYFGFEGGTLVLIASVLGHCLSFTFLSDGIYIYSRQRSKRITD